MYKDIHNRRMKLVYSTFTPDNLDYEPIKDKEYIGMFEKRYGYPTDIDEVWKHREEWMDCYERK